MTVDPLPTAHPSGEMWANTGHPVSPDKLAFAMGAPGDTFTDHAMRWDNSGKNGHYAPIPAGQMVPDVASSAGKS
jgi:hypothetical protein